MSQSDPAVWLSVQAINNQDQRPNQASQCLDGVDVIFL